MASLPIPVFGNGFFLEKPHLPVNGDCVLKYHYFFQECDQGKAVWDFSHAIPKGESHYMQWINLGDSVFVKIENGMQSNFRIQNDTLYWAGYENPLLRVEDSIAPIMAIKSSSKHGGKELDRENGLDWYDSQARHYDPARQSQSQDFQSGLQRRQRH